MLGVDDDMILAGGLDVIRRGAHRRVFLSLFDIHLYCLVRARSLPLARSRNLAGVCNLAPSADNDGPEEVVSQID